MVSVKFENIWTLMSKYTFEVDSDAKEEDFTCMICKKIMVDSYQSLCGCQYCRRCILQYLGGERKCCPGDKEECKEEHLLVDVNVCRSVILNRKILKLRVHCPNKCCETIEELIKMEDHLRVCIKRAVECPYGVLGCDNKGGSKDKISTHINEDSLKHNKLLIDYIQNMKDEFSNLINNTKNYENMNQELKELRENLGMTISEISSLKEESTKKDNKIENLKKEICDLKDDFKKCKDEVVYLKNELERSKGETKSLKDGSVENEGDEESQNIEEEDEERIKITNERERKCNILNVPSLNPYPDILCQSLNVDFVWRVDGLSKKRGQRLFSDSFMSNNYRLCLYLWIENDNLGGYVYVGGAIMKGEKDDEVEWPLRHILRVSILDQDSLSSVETVTISYDTYTRGKNSFVRPKTERNGPLCDRLSLRYYTLKRTHSVLVRDSLLISGMFIPL